MTLKIIMNDGKIFKYENIKKYEHSVLGKAILVEEESGKLHNLNIAYAKLIYLK